MAEEIFRNYIEKLANSLYTFPPHQIPFWFLLNGNVNIPSITGLSWNSTGYPYFIPNISNSLMPQSNLWKDFFKTETTVRLLSIYSNKLH